MIGIAVVALQPFEFEGHSYVRGQQFETTPINAAAFTYQRWARYATDEDSVPTTETKALKVEAPKTAPKRTRKPRTPHGTYNRRDIAPDQTK